MTAAEPKRLLPAGTAARWPLTALDTGALPGAMPPGLRAGTLRLGVLSNANSGHNRRKLGRLEALARRYPHVVHLSTGHGDDVREALAEFARHGIDVLAINGGDGTIARVLGEILERQPFPARLHIALLPGGTANMTSDRLGVRGSLPRAARRLFEWTGGTGRDACPVLNRPILRVRFADGRDNAYGMFLGAGAVIQGTEYAHRTVHARGLRDNAGLTVAVARTLWGLRRGDPRFSRAVRLSVTADGREFLSARPVGVLMVSCLERLFLGIKPFWGPGEGPLCSTVIGPSPRRLFRSLPWLLAGRPTVAMTETGGYRSCRAYRLGLHLDGTLNIDGELHAVDSTNGGVTVDAGGTFNFLRL
ncbi:MAG: diacylglycerol/lipid kinase family protein [Pseudohaliea sp.]